MSGPDELARARAEGRLEALRAVRKAAIALDRDPENDPYLWGYGAGKICVMLTEAVRKAREDVKGLPS